MTISMRDVSPQNSNSSSSQFDLKVVVRFLIEFVKHPVQRISELPDWNWPGLFFLQILFALISGTLAGLIKLNIYSVAFGIVIMPVVSTIAALLLALFLYYYFQFFESRTHDYRKIFTLVILSSLPFYIFQILSEYFSFITLIGFAFTSLLGIVGLSENFAVPRKRATQIVGFLFILILIAWFGNRLQMN